MSAKRIAAYAVSAVLAAVAVGFAFESGRWLAREYVTNTPEIRARARFEECVAKYQERMVSRGEAEMLCEKLLP